ncbi:MAG: hypothetical protein AAFX79_10085 [Planctomycetota bacterium]
MRTTIAALTLCATLGVAGLPALAQNSVSASAQAQADLPKAAKLAEKAVEAVGGRSKLEKIKSLRVVMSMEAMGMQIEMDTAWARAGGRLVKMNMGGFGETSMGTDGTIAWGTNPITGEYMILPDEQAEQLNDQASMHMAMIDPIGMRDEELEKFETVGRESFRGVDSFKVLYVTKEGDSEGHMFYDAKTGMPVGFRQTEAGPMGQQTTTVAFEDWKAVEGVKFFHKAMVESAQMGPQPIAMTVKTLEANKLDASAFEPPAEVKEMAAKQAEQSGGAAEIDFNSLPPAKQQEAREQIAAIRGAGKDVARQAIESLERGMTYMPDGNDKLTLQYVVQELKKYVNDG